MSKANQVIVHAKDPANFPAQLFEKARAGKLPTWKVDDKKGKTQYTHSAEQWERKAWLVQKTATNGVLQFRLNPPEGEEYDQDVRGVYLGRFVEMLVNRFGDDISSIEVSREE